MAIFETVFLGKLNSLFLENIYNKQNTTKKFRSMNQFFQIISYIFLFLVFYFEIFILLSFLEKKEEQTHNPDE